jgi:hypothetical protein
MMPDNGLVTVAVCGLSVVCLGVIIIGALLFLRSTGRIVLPSIFGGDDANRGARLRLIASPRGRRRANLQAQADALDFDAALAQAAVQPNQPNAPIPLPPAELPPLEPSAPRNRVIQPPWADEYPGVFPDADDED